MPKLKITMPDASEVTHELDDELVTIGRVSENSIQIDDASVSSRHAQLAVTGNGGYQLTDLNSTNGTRVNGAAVTEANLRNGDRVRFGQIDCAFYSDDESHSEPLPTAAEPDAKPATQSHKPTNFANSSPFQKKSRQKDPAGMYIMIFAVVALLLFIGALVQVFMLQKPT